MTAQEFAAYEDRAVPEYAEEKVASGQWSRGDALERARKGFQELLPDGLATPDNRLLMVRDPALPEPVGILWYAVEERAGQRIAYVYDVWVEPKYQRRGYGTRAFGALEVEVAARGLRGIGLHVFGHNPAAQALYQKLGFVVTDINMFKPLPLAGI